MINSLETKISRRGLLGAFAAASLIAAPTYSNAASFLRGAGDIRRIKMYSGRTGESVDTIYWIEGEYIKEALKEIAEVTLNSIAKLGKNSMPDDANVRLA